jgi:hypothetical protein
MKFGIVPINKGEFTDSEVLISFVQLAEAVGYEILNVSVVGGFAFSDTSKNGLRAPRFWWEMAHPT